MMKIIVGSCSFESLKEGLLQAEFIDKMKKKYPNFSFYMRAMLWKPRTEKKSFQGIGKNGIEDLKKILEIYPDMIFAIEVMEKSHLYYLMEYKVPAVYQIGTRNSQNYALLNYLGSFEDLTIIYKRGMTMFLDEFIHGAGYLEPEKNKIWLCLRGIRTFEDHMRNTPDIGAIIALKERFTYTPEKFKIIFDPSHASGKREYVEQLSYAAHICGADGLEIEIHSNPDNAKSDSRQTISFEKLDKILNNLKGSYESTL